MIQSIASTLIFGKPLIMYGGIGTFLLLVATAFIGYSNSKGITRIPFKWHVRLAILSILGALIHGMFGLSAYFNF